MSENFVGRGKRDSWSRYDKLPADVRKVFQQAPHKYHTNWFKAGPDIEVARRRCILDMLKDSSDECARTYGDDHPCVERLRAQSERWMARYFGWARR